METFSPEELAASTRPTTAHSARDHRRIGQLRQAQDLVEAGLWRTPACLRLAWEAARDKSPAVRCNAYLTIGDLGTEDELQALETASQEDADPLAARWARIAMSRIHTRFETRGLRLPFEAAT